MREIARLHVKVLPNTFSSKLGAGFVKLLYEIVGWVGEVQIEKRGQKTVGALSKIGQLILTLIVDPEWQRKGIGTKLIESQKGRLFVYTEERSLGFYKKLKFHQCFKIGKTIVLCRLD